MMRKNEKGVVYIAIWVDNSLFVRDKEAILEMVSDLKKEGFNLKLEGTLEAYLSYEITFNKDKSIAWIYQPHLITKIDKKFGPMVKKMQRYNTPGAPGVGILRNPGSVIDKEKHGNYRSGVGVLLFLVKHTRPDIANLVCELSKALGSPSPAANKGLLKLLKFVLDTRNLVIKIKPKPFEDGCGWEVICFSDSDFAGNVESRISTAGLLLYVMGVPVSWKSKGMKSLVGIYGLWLTVPDPKIVTITRFMP